MAPLNAFSFALTLPDYQIQTTFLAPKNLLVALSARMRLPPATVSHEAALVGVL